MKSSWLRLPRVTNWVLTQHFEGGLRSGSAAAVVGHHREGPRVEQPRRGDGDPVPPGPLGPTALLPNQVLTDPSGVLLPGDGAAVEEPWHLREEEGDLRG